MENKPKFSINDPNSYEIVRGVVFEILRRKEINQLPNSFYEGLKKYVEIDSSERNANRAFLNLFRHVLWDLIMQRIVTPGLDSMNPNLPFFSLTEYGEKILQEEGVNPYDPEGYLSKYSELFGGNCDDIAYRYLEESLKCFYSGCYLSSSMILGIASERVFLGLCDSICGAIQSSREKVKFQKILNGISMVAKVDFAKMKIQNSVIPKNFKSKINTVLLGIVELLRNQRNDLGHPQDDLRAPTREDVYVYLRLFLSYSQIIRDFVIYLNTAQI